ncbi:D-arabinose 5-phosphate isomerase [Alkanindiges hydrocarboniclasticus]|uniref:Arabinose 5-phosphate isomerase n=1 Tax=Alkanindiges hydrocarboniclasticus TaxID=1907941 RepID=A0A1S8CWD8_9GAMM|nr:KpsF/GutQ family sugar-phosphate isomerase [Alkanindiges hydrocarboniclasticus]ONG40014.1 D-arabinose 5-phosphate isomerase [Alkanindiges hydrocarboniclasticus]
MSSSQSHFDSQDFLNSALATLQTEQQALSVLASHIDARFVKACNLILACTGRVVITGMGKSGHIGRKIAATLASTGTPSFFMHPGEAGHGDLGMLVPGDVLVAISNSGKSDEIMMLMPLVKRNAIPLITISRDDLGPMPQLAEVALILGESKEACPLGLAPTSSTTATLALGDALAVALLEARGFTADDFARSHPAGALGKRLLLHVSDIMHKGRELPKIMPHTSLHEALLEMTSKRLGMAAVVDEKNHVLGVFTDGDLRRTFEKMNSIEANMSIEQIMTKTPLTITADVRAVEALELMNHKKINQFLVVNDAEELIGIITMHDIISAGVN